MPQDIKLLSARRAYEFRPDEVRLTVLTIAQVIERIQNVFKFQVAQVGTPAPTFGPVAQTLPPGIVFNLGSFVSDAVGIVPIRLLHFEQRRVVIDVAGPSTSLDPIFAALATVVNGLSAPDGSPALGTPFRTLNASEISARLAFPMASTLAPGIAAIISEAMGAVDRPQVVVPTLTFQVQDENTEYGGTAPVNQTSGPMAQLALRQGTHPNEQVYFSTAPLDSDAHVTYLASLEQTLVDAAPPGERSKFARGPQSTNRKKRTAKSQADNGVKS